MNSPANCNSIVVCIFCSSLFLLKCQMYLSVQEKKMLPLMDALLVNEGCSDTAIKESCPIRYSPARWCKA